MQPWVALGRHRPTHWGAWTSQSEIVSPHTRASLQAQIHLCAPFPRWQSHRRRSWMWRSWAGVVTDGLHLWGQLDVLQNSLKWRWRRLMVEKLTLNSANSSGGHSCSQHCMLSQLETSVALCCVTKLHILEWPFIVPSTSFLIWHTCQVDGLSWQRRNAY